MIIHLFIGLLILGGAAFSYQGVRLQKFFLYPAILAVSYIGWAFYWGVTNNVTDFYSFSWISSKYYPVNLDFFSTKEVYTQLLTFFIIAIMVCYSVIWNKQERQKLNIIALTSLNLAAIIMLICGQNTLQILIATCFLDVLGFCTINDITARRQYIFYNLLADLGLFTAFAMIGGGNAANQLQILDNIHINVISLFLITLSVMLKAGIFPFQGYYLQMITVNDVRRIILGFLSTPIAGFFILLKVMPLIQENVTCLYILKGGLILSFVWNFFASLISDNINGKKIHINLVFYAFIFWVVLAEQGQNLECLGKILILQFLLNNILHGGQKYNQARYLAVILLISAVVLTLLKFSQFISYSYLGILMLMTGSVMYRIHQASGEEQDVFYLIVGGIITSYIINEEMQNSYLFWTYMASFGLLLSGFPYYGLSGLQMRTTTDIWSKLLYLLFIAPIEFLGRILWLTIDFIIIERTFLNSFSRFYIWLQKIFAKMHNFSIKNLLWYWFFAGLLLSYCVYGEGILWK
ncbi:MAG: hypothetical protein IJ660_01530 [Alphaproteobacteria bacterium]|nr:hypothetical protein [Alphaproteobacteria bacterium]